MASPASDLDRALALLHRGDVRAACALWEANPDLATRLAQAVTLHSEGERLTLAPPLPTLPTPQQWWVAASLLGATGRAGTALVVDDAQGWRDLAPLQQWPDLERFVMFNADEVVDLSALSGLPALEILSIDGALQLQRLPPLPPTLEQLELSHAPAILALPPAETMAQLVSLRCVELPALRDIGPLAACTRLRFAALSLLHPSADLGVLASWTALEELELSNLDGDPGVAALRCPALVDLILDGLPHLGTLGDLSRWPRLRRLSLGRSRAEPTLELAHDTLERVALMNVSGPRTVSLALPALRTLHVAHLPDLQRLVWRGPTGALKRVRLPKGVPALDIHSVAGLDRVALRWCAQLTLVDLPDLAAVRVDNTVALTHLELRRLPLLAAVPEVHSEAPFDLVLEALPQVRALDLAHHHELRRLAVRDLPALASLSLRGSPCAHLVLADLPSLRTLDLQGHTALEDATLLEGLTSVEELDISDCGRLEALDLSATARLHTLRARQCGRLTRLALPPSVTTLDVRRCPALTVAWPHGGAPITVDAAGGRSLEAVATWPLDVPIDTLRLDRCTLTRPAMPALQVRHLILHRWSQLTDLSGLCALRGLEVLELRGPPAVLDLSPLAALPTLQRVVVPAHQPTPQGLPPGITLEAR